MALAYTAPTWTNGSGEGVSASNLQAISDCIQGLVQGSDKAVTAISINGSVITMTFADGSQDTGTVTNLKGISSVTKTSVGLIDTYTITYTDGSTYQFTVKNGKDGTGIGDMEKADYDASSTVLNAGGIPAYVESKAGSWSSAVSCLVGDTTCTISDANILTTSIIEPYIETSSGDAVAYTNITVTTGQAVITFGALVEAADIKVKITNL